MYVPIIYYTMCQLFTKKNACLTFNNGENFGMCTTWYNAWNLVALESTAFINNSTKYVKQYWYCCCYLSKSWFSWWWSTLQMMSNISIMASPSAWTSSDEMLSTSADLPFFSDFTAASTSSHRMGKLSLSVGRGTSSTLGSPIDVCVQFGAVLCPPL